MRYGMPWPGAETARLAEHCGVSAFVAGDSANRDSYVTLAQMVAGTTSTQVGTGIAYAFARTPFAHAAGLRQLHHDAPGRIFAGFGSGAFTLNRDWFGVAADRPVARMRELIQAVRSYLQAESGGQVEFDGEFYHLHATIAAPVLGRLEIPLVVGAFNRLMIQAAGEVADGVIGHGLFTSRWWTETVRPNLRAGREAANRTEPPREYGWVITAIDDDDPDRARLDARRMIAFSLTEKGYDPLVELHGWQQPVQELRAAFRRGDTDGMAAAVSAEMLHAISPCGTTSEARKSLQERGNGLPGDIAFLAPPSFLVSERRKDAYARASLALVEH